MIGTGNTFLMQDSSQKRHLWVVLQIRTVLKEKMCAIVNISSKKMLLWKMSGNHWPRVSFFFVQNLLHPVRPCPNNSLEKFGILAQ